MGIRLSRRRRAALGLSVLAAAVWLLCGLRRVPEEDGRAAVLDSPLGLVEPQRCTPGWHLVPPGVLRLSFYPVRSATLTIAAGDGSDPLTTSDGSLVDAEILLRYRVDDDRLLEVHRGLGPAFERKAVGRWAGEVLRKTVGGSAYSEISGNRSGGVQDEISRLLGERMRVAGLVLQACEVGRIRLRLGSSDATATAARLPAGRILLVGLDGADWNIVDPLRKAGRMPRLDRLVKEGVRARLRTISPMLSPVLWTSIATGVQPQRHGILDFVTGSEKDGGQVPVSSRQRRVKAFWNILSERGLSVGVAGWWATWPAEEVNGFVVSDRVAYQLLGVRPVEERNRGGKVFPASGDEQVVAATVSPEAIGAADLNAFLRLPADPTELPEKESRLIDDLRTVIASGRTYTAATLALAGKRPPDLTAVYLEGTDTVAHLFMPYAPPPLEGIDPGAQRRFGKAVDAYYEEADRLLGRLIDGLEPKTIVVLSDHGFRTGDNRPRTESRPGYGAAADWHRQYGIAVFSGPAFRRGADLEEVSLLDIAPTLLRLAGLPVGEDMEGRPIAAAFDPAWRSAHPEQYIASWEGTGARPAVIAAAAASGGHEADPAAGGGSERGAPAGQDPVPTAAHGSNDADGPRQEDAPADATGQGAASADDAGADSADAAGDAERVARLQSLGYLSASGMPNGHNNRGATLLFQGRAEEALREFELALQGGEDRNIARLNMVRARIELRDYDGALRDLDAHAQVQPRSRDGAYLRGQIAERRRQTDEAERLYRDALQIDPHFTEARNDLGLLLERRGRHDEALQEFRRVIDTDPEFGEAYNNIGIVERSRGRTQEAEEAFRRALKASPEFAGAYSNLALLLEDRREFAEAESLLRQAVKRAPKDPDIRSNLGALLHLLGRDEEAVQELSRATTLDPHSASAWNNLGTALGRLGRPAEEMAAYRRALSLDPSSAEVHYNLGRALLRAGQMEEGKGEIEAARRLRPNDPDLARKIEEVLEGTGASAGSPPPPAAPEEGSR